MLFFLQTGGEGCAFGVAFGGMEGWEEGGRGGALSACFSRFSNVILKGGCPPVFQGTFLHVFFVFRKNAHTPAICHHFVTFGVMFVDVCALCVACFSFCWRPRHFAWTLLTQFGAFFHWLGGARPECDETRQPRHPKCAFCPHPGFAFGTILDALLFIFQVL